MRKLSDLKELIGNTPLVEILYTYNNKRRKAYMKAEWFNLTGSIKDRVAYNILNMAIKEGKLKRNQTIVETTSGNMGISISALGTYLGHKVVVFMPKNMSDERKNLLINYNAKLYLTKDFKSAFRKAKSFAKKNNAFMTEQFSNINNTLSHEKGVAKEIKRQLGYNFDCVVAGVGTSGTIMGLANAFKNKGKRVYAVEPKSSLLLTLGNSIGEHKIQGLSDEIIPKIYNKDMIDAILPIEDDDAIAMANKLCSLGLGVGVSGGANFLGCVLSGEDVCVSVFPDDNKKYLLGVKENKVSKLVDSIKIKGIKVVKKNQKNF